MDAFIEPIDGPDLAKAERRLVAVVIDALRASVTITAALGLGAERVVPVSSLEEAREMKQGAGVLIAGERGGRWMEGFDFGNSPGQLGENAARLQGATLVLTTSNGTGTILRAKGARAVVIGCLPNLSAAAAKTFALAQAHRADIALLPAGWLGNPAEEDLYMAGLLGRALAGLGAGFEPDPELDLMLEAEPTAFFLESAAGQRLISLGYREDVIRCARIDSYDLVPVYLEGEIRVG